MTTDHDSEDELLLYWSGELDDEAARTVERRLSADPEAVAYLASLNQLRNQVDELPVMRPEHPIAPKVSGNSQANSNSVSFPFLRRLVPIAAAAAVAFSLGAFFVKTKQSDAPSPEIADAITTPNANLDSPRDKLSARLFSSSKRFTSDASFNDALERAQRIKSRLDSDPI